MAPQRRLPAEWEPHEATWLAWPHERADWPGKFTPIRWVYGEFVRYVSQLETVRILVQDERVRAEAELVLRKSGANLPAVEFYLCPTDRSWTRDFCPVFVKDGSGAVHATKWQFNGWAKYSNHKRDNAAGAYVARRLKIPLEKTGLVLEGGSIETNGQGTLLATEECLLSSVQARNPGVSRETLEAAFARHFGIRKTLWLNRGIAGDDTHGHIDDLARFVDPVTVVTVVEQDRSDENYEPLQENLHLLRRMTDQDGNKLKVVPLPMPRPVWFDGQRLPASYANFYIANGLVLMPTFNDPDDRVALATLARLFPGRKLVGIHAVDLVLGLGTLHCMTQQQPARGEAEL